MLAVLLNGVAAILREAGTSIGKKEFDAHHEDLFVMGFINSVIGVIIFVTIGFLFDSLVIDPQSFLTLSIRIILELILTTLTLMAIVRSSRSTFSFYRTLTISLLLISDIFLAYQFKASQIIGIAIIMITIGHLYYSKTSDQKGRNLTIITALIAVLTTTLYQYNITNYNSIAGEQSVVLTVQLIYLFIASLVISKQNPIKELANKLHLSQSFLTGISNSIVSYSFNFAPATIVIASKRVFGLIASIASGHFAFHETKFSQKIIYGVLVSIALILISV